MDTRYGTGILGRQKRVDGGRVWGEGWVLFLLEGDVFFFLGFFLIFFVFFCCLECLNKTVVSI